MPVQKDAHMLPAAVTLIVFFSGEDMFFGECLHKPCGLRGLP